LVTIVTGVTMDVPVLLATPQPASSTRPMASAARRTEFFIVNLAELLMLPKA
jgi:hypothetical protein